jgi:hypothetical protein
LAKVTGPNQFSLAVGHQTSAKVDDCITYTPDVVIISIKTSQRYTKYERYALRLSN